MSQTQDVLHLKENQAFQLNCTTTKFGHPAPKLSLNLNNEIHIVSNDGIKDGRGGQLSSVSLEAVALKHWHGKRVTCNLQQQHFPIKNQSITLQIDRKSSN